ncbi:MAG TPA: hypothetical protein VHS31_18475 [Tepidisphaeraceae bacterium]|jgi:hypothetical protein|nr:hypothetical protein [Tepidisphaeraceae bacterium]
MFNSSKIVSRRGMFVGTCALILVLVGCISMPLGDPEKAKVDDKLVGAWLSPVDSSNGQATLFTVVPYDSRTCLVSEMAFSKDGDTIKPAGRFDWKMWLVDVKGTRFAALEMKNPQFAFGQEAERYAVAKITTTGDTITITPIKDDFVKNAKITTSKELEDLVGANLENAQMFSDPMTLTKVKDDQKEAVGKVIDAFSQVK